MKLKIFTFLTLLLLVIGCENTQQPNMLVPATVSENPNLPSVSIKVAGIDRKVHVRTFGTPTNPTLFIIHGSLSDMRAFLKFQQLSDKYYVVMWDLRGNGLSERVPASELSIVSMVEEIRQMKNIYSPNKPISMIAHSWSGVFTSLFLTKYPQDVAQVVLLEPIALKSDLVAKSNIKLDLFTGGFTDMIYNAGFMSGKTDEELDYQGLAILNAGVPNFYCDKTNIPDWPVWRLGIRAVITWDSELLVKGKMDYDFTQNLKNFNDSVLLVGGSCSPIGYQFQHDYQQALFAKARTALVQNAGHRMVVEQWSSLVSTIKGYLIAYK